MVTITKDFADQLKVPQQIGPIVLFQFFVVVLLLVLLLQDLRRH
jgi:hypothetical protein